MLSQLLISTSLFLTGKYGSDMTPLSLRKAWSRSNPRDFPACLWNEMLLECLSLIIIFFIHQKIISKYTLLLFRQMKMQENPQRMTCSIKDLWLHLHEALVCWLGSWSCTMTCFFQIQQVIFSVFCWTLAEWECVITQSA